MTQNRLEQSPDGSDDKGASAVLIALSMVVLMGFAAISVDAGLAFEDRRQQQSAADVGALAALQFAKTIPTAGCPPGGAALAACRGAVEAIDVVEGTLPGRYPPTGAPGIDWDTCVDSSKPAEYTIASSLSDCISFTGNFQKARVVLPGTDVETAFARVIGFNSIAVSALAEAGLDLNQSADVLPWALGPTGSELNYACLFTNSSSNLNIGPCNGPNQGNFGKLDLSLYGNEHIITPEICGNAMPNTKMAVNLITGSDHPLEEEGAVDSSTVNDFTNCAIITNPVDQIQTQTGNSAGPIREGLFEGVNETTPNYEGRLLCKSGESDEYGEFKSAECVTVGNQFSEQVDHTPLWDFIAGGVDAELNFGDTGKCSGVNTTAEMLACLQAWRDYTGTHTISLFTSGINGIGGIQTAPRFAAIPILESDPFGGTGTYNIIDFQPVYLDTTYFQCGGQRCRIVHTPDIPDNPTTCPDQLTPADQGCGWTETGNKRVDAVTSYILTIDMLPLEIQDDFPATKGSIIFNLSK